MTLNPPPGLEDRVVPLYAHRENGVITMQFEITKEELLNLIVTRRVVVQMMGQTIAPMRITTLGTPV